MANLRRRRPDCRAALLPLWWPQTGAMVTCPGGTAAGENSGGIAWRMEPQRAWRAPRCSAPRPEAAPLASALWFRRGAALPSRRRGPRRAKVKAFMAMAPVAPAVPPAPVTFVATMVQGFPGQDPGAPTQGPLRRFGAGSAERGFGRSMLLHAAPHIGTRSGLPTQLRRRHCRGAETPPHDQAHADRCIPPRGNPGCGDGWQSPRRI